MWKLAHACQFGNQGCAIYTQNSPSIWATCSRTSSSFHDRRARVSRAPRTVSASDAPSSSCLMQISNCTCHHSQRAKHQPIREAVYHFLTSCCAAVRLVQTELECNMHAAACWCVFSHKMHLQSNPVEFVTPNSSTVSLSDNLVQTITTQSFRRYRTVSHTTTKVQ